MPLEQLANVRWKRLFIAALIGIGAVGYYPIQGQTTVGNNNLAPITAVNAAKLHEIGLFKTPESGSPIPNLAWSPDSQTLYSGGKDTASVIAWDVATGSQKFTLNTDYSAFALSSDGAYLAVNSSGDLGGVTIYDTHTQAVKAFLHCSGGSLQIAFSPTNSKLLVVETEGGNTLPPRLDFWIIKAKMQIDTTYAEPCAPDYQVRAAGAVPFLVFNPNGQTLLYGTRLLDVVSLKQTTLFKNVPDYGITAAAFSPDGKLLATNLYQSHLITVSSSLWSIQNNHPAATLDVAQDPTITGVTITGLVFSPNNQLLALRGYGMVKGVSATFVWVWDAKTYKPIIILSEPDNGILEGSMMFSPDSERLAVADTVIHIYAVTM